MVFRPPPVAVLALAAGLLSACALDPHVEPVSVDVPDAFKATPASARAAWPDAQWWKGFGSAELDSLIARAQAANLDLAAAKARVLQADAALRVAGASLLPTLDLNVQADVTRASKTTRSGGRKIDYGTSYQVGPEVSYEIDFWGKNAAARDAARQSAIASRFDQETVALTVVSSVATTYFTILEMQDRIASAHAVLAAEEETLKALEARVAVGTGLPLDVAQQVSTVAQQRATIPPLEQTRDQSIDALAILLGEPPERLTVRGGSLDDIKTPVVAPGLPSQLLTRRPDIRQAEAQLESQRANVQEARANLFPSISLTGQTGYQSDKLALLFGPGAFASQITASLAQTIFDGGALQGQLAEQRGSYLELLQDYRSTVLTAFQDVDDSLIAIDRTTEQERLQAQAVAAAQRAYDITRGQLAQGTVDVTTVVTTQQALFTARDTLAQVRGSRLTAIADLFQALGGGWAASGAQPGLP